MKRFHVCVNRQSTINFFNSLVQETMEYREKNNVIRKDFMHLLIQLKNSGKLIDSEEVGNMHLNNNGDKVSVEDLVGQAFVFFIAGYETPTNTICFTLHALAVHKDAQNKCRQEISQVLKKHGGKLTYEAISELSYVESVINGEYSEILHSNVNRIEKKYEAYRFR